MDVLIVGAGPTGLLMGAELQRYGLSYRIIDKLLTASTQSKALVIQPRILEIFHLLGIESRFLKEGIKLKRANPFSQGKRIAHLDFTTLESPFPFILGIEQSKTERFLEEHLDQKVERHVELINLEEGIEGVKATLLHHNGGQKEEIRVPWVIGCDGAHSFVRKSLDLPFKGKVFSDIFSLADVHIQWKHPHDELSIFLESSGVIAAFPLPDKNRYRLVFQLERCRHALNKKQIPLKSLVSSEVIPEPTLEETTEIVHRCADPDALVSDPIWLANFHINSRLTSNYRTGKIFIAGDAAHVHSPVGGQGMNTGFQDVFNLAWKLALTHQQKLSPSLLDTYHEERHTIAEILLKATERASIIATLHNPFLILLRNNIAQFMMSRPGFQQKLVHAISQISLSYPKSSFIKEDGPFKGGPHAGERAPNATLTKEGIKTDLFTLWKKPSCYFLLLFNPDPEFLRNLPSFDCCTPLIISKEDEAFTRYGMIQNGAYIIRPDTYVGYRQGKLNLAQIQAYFDQLSPKRY